MSALGRHAALKSRTGGQQCVGRGVEGLGQTLEDARAWHVLVGFVSPERVGSDPNTRGEFNLRKAGADASLA
jgi:hypothetical protein